MVRRTWFVRAATALLCVAPLGCSADDDHPAMPVVESTVAAPTIDPGMLLDPAGLIKAWTPANIVFATTMVVSRGDAPSETHRIWSDATSGSSVRVVVDAAGKPMRVSLVDSRLRMVSVDATGTEESTNLADVPPAVTTAVSLIPLIPAVGGLKDPRVNWSVNRSDARGIVFETASDGPFSAVLVVDVDTLLPKEYTLQQGSETLHATFTDNRFVVRDASLVGMFHVEKLKAWLR